MHTIFGFLVFVILFELVVWIRGFLIYFIHLPIFLRDVDRAPICTLLRVPLRGDGYAIIIPGIISRLSIMCIMYLRRYTKSLVLQK